MTSISYDEIFNFFFGEIDSDVDLLKLEEEDLLELELEYLHKAISKPYILRLFSKFNFDDENKTLTFEMSFQVIPANENI